MILSILYYLLAYWFICFVGLLIYIELAFFESENTIQVSLEWVIKCYNERNNTQIHPYIYNDTPTIRFYLTYWLISGILPPLLILQTILIFRKITKNKTKK
jgi:hypothetical protein